MTLRFEQKGNTWNTVRRNEMTPFRFFWPMLVWLWITALAVVSGWAGVSVANAEQRQEEVVRRQAAEAFGSVVEGKACKKKSTKAIQVVDIPAEVRKRIPVFYSEIRRPVRVKLDKNYKDFRFMQKEARPKGFFQLAGAHDKKLCAEVLEAFNEPDSRILGVGGDKNDWSSEWLSNNSKIVPFTGVEKSGVVLGTKNSKQFECATLDIDGDGREEYLYRYTTWLSSRIYQEVEIMDHTADALSCRSDLPREFVSKYLENMFSLSKDRLPEEWEVTQGAPLFSVTADKRSEEMITSPKDRNEIIRNVGNHYSVFWNFYRVPSGVVMVSIPELNRAPPELMVFAPARDAVRLQCIIMPVIWYHPPRREPMDPEKG
jgi:hypothetical protein